MIFEGLSILTRRCCLASSPEPHIVCTDLGAENLGDTVSSIIVIDECVSAIAITIIMSVFGVKGTDGYHDATAGHYT